MKLVTIYGLIDPRTNECRYVGKADDLHHRMRKHINGASKGRTKKDTWLRKLQREGHSPVPIVLEQTHTWTEAEQFWIMYLRYLGARLTNLTVGGEGSTGVKMTSEQRQKMAAAARLRPARSGYKLSEAARANISASARGRKLSPEHRAKIGVANKAKWLDPMYRIKMMGRAPSEETRAKIAAAGTGRVKPAEARAKVSTALKGKPKSAEHVEKIKLINKGRKHTAEARSRMSAASKGKPKTPEHNKRVSEAKKQYWDAWREARGVPPSRSTINRRKRKEKQNKLIDK